MNSLETVQSQIEKLKILVVDDEPIARKVLVKGLTTCGYKNITAVASAKEAIELIKNNVYNIALCDVLMPEIDGFGLLKAICDIPNIKEMTIIMVSATEDLSTVYKCLNHGADDYIFKPIRLPQIQNLWSNIWKKKKEQKIQKELQEEKAKSNNLGLELQHLQSQLSDLSGKIDHAVDTPITAITRTIVDLQSKAHLTPEVKDALSKVLQSLASSNIYKPAFNKMLENKSVEGVTKRWLMGELGGIVASNSLRDSSLDNEIGNVHLSESNEEEIKELRSFTYDAWSKSQDDLVKYIHSIYNDFGLLELFNVDISKFKRFVLAIRSRYIAKNPYHNFIHAFDVTQSVYSFLSKGNASLLVTNLEIFGILTAALCHDVGHFGLNNMYLIATGHELAIRYNDQSVLENFHCSTTFSVLQDPECNIFENLDKTQYTSIRKLMVHCILATDLAKHMELIPKITAITDNFQKDNEDHRLLLLQLLIKSADISNPAKPFPIARYWADMIQEEFFIQGDKERAENREISGFMDRENPNLPLMQTGFADYFVIPMYTLLKKILPNTEECLEILLTNRKTWENIKNEKGNIIK